VERIEVVWQREVTTVTRKERAVLQNKMFRKLTSLTGLD